MFGVGIGTGDRGGLGKEDEMDLEWSGLEMGFWMRTGRGWG